MCIHAKCYKNPFRLELNSRPIFINVLNTRIFKCFLWDYSNWREKWTKIIKHVWLSHVLDTLHRKVTEYHLTAQSKSKLKELLQLLHVTAEDGRGTGMHCTYREQSHSKVCWCDWRPGWVCCHYTGEAVRFCPRRKTGKRALLSGQWSLHRYLKDAEWFPGHETLTSLKQMIILLEERNMPIKAVLVSDRDVVKKRSGGKHVQCPGDFCPGANGLRVCWYYCKVQIIIPGACRSFETWINRHVWGRAEQWGITCLWSKRPAFGR